MSEAFNMAGRFTKSAFNHAKDGFKKVDEETFNQRLEICKSCEFFNSESIRCGKCGCFLNIKASWNSEKCPIDKW
jgi:hypothetical protein